MKKTVTTPPKKATTSTRQVAEFEVEIQTGNRAISGHPRAGENNKAQTSVGNTEGANAVALRRQRATERRLSIWLLVTFLALSLAVWGTAKWWQPMLVGDVVARVNGHVITYQQVDKEARLSNALSTASTGKEQGISIPAMLEEMILLELEAQAAQQESFTVSQQEVDAAMAEIVQKANIVPGSLDDALRSYNVTLDDLRASLAKTTLAEQFAARRIAGDITEPQTRIARINAWQAALVQKARIERMRGAETGVGPRVGTAAPDFTLKQIGGKTVSLSELKGKVVILYVWAPWCPACRAEVPILEDAYINQRAGPPDNSFELLAVASQSELPNVTSFMQEFGITFPVFMDTQGEVTELYQSFAIPTTFFIDKEGIIQAIHVGQMDAKVLQLRLDAAR